MCNKTVRSVLFCYSPPWGHRKGTKDSACVACWLTVGARAAGRGGRGPNGAVCPIVNLAPGVAETSLVARPRVSPVGKLQFTNASRACGLCVFPYPYCCGGRYDAAQREEPSSAPFS